jgi:general secretion pathway protein I
MMDMRTDAHMKSTAENNTTRSVLGRKDGFTLLEVLVAFVLLAATVTVILQLFSSGIKALSLSEDYATAVVRAESKMREVLDNEQLAENAWSETSPDGYRFDITVAKAYEARTKDLPMKVLEIGITMSWKMGGKDKSMMLNTMKTIKPQV